MGDTQGTLEERLRAYRPYRFGEGEWFGPEVCTEAADEIASLRARVAVLSGALTEIAAMEIPTEFQAKGDPASGRIWRSHQAGCFGRCQGIARQALKDTPDAE